jgi:hypothetical protein
MTKAPSVDRGFLGHSGEDSKVYGLRHVWRWRRRRLHGLLGRLLDFQVDLKMTRRMLRH